MKKTKVCSNQVEKAMYNTIDVKQLVKEHIDPDCYADPYHSLLFYICSPEIMWSIALSIIEHILLWNSWANFQQTSCGLLLKDGRIKVCSDGYTSLTKIRPPCPYMVKIHLKILFSKMKNA